MKSQTQNGEQEFATGNYYSKPAALGKIMNSNNDEKKYEYIRVRNGIFFSHLDFIDHLPILLEYS